MPTFFEAKQIATPGDLLAEGDYIAGENTYREDKRVYASRTGLVELNDKNVSIVALKAFYVPKPGDIIIGTVVDIGFNGWTININGPYRAFLKPSDVLSRPFKPQKDELSQVLDVGDLVVAKIVSYDRTHDPQITVAEPGLGKITKGQVVKVTPTKVPRVIGKKGSMISMIKAETGCQIILGLNGVVLVTGKTPEQEQAALMAIRKIEEESHTTGLTDRVTQMLRTERSKREESKNE